MMQYLTAMDPETTTGKSKELFDTIQKTLGMVPNMMRTMGNSPALLSGYLSLNAALGESSLSPGIGELIALSVANANGCNYCNAAHSFIGEKLVHLRPEAIADAREGRSADIKIQAALNFARVLLAKKGQVSQADIDGVKAVGFNDGGIAEIIGHVGLNILTNYFNSSAKVILDFPEVKLVATAAL